MRNGHGQAPVGVHGVRRAGRNGRGHVVSLDSGAKRFKGLNRGEQILGPANDDFMAQVASVCAWAWLCSIVRLQQGASIESMQGKSFCAPLHTTPTMSSPSAHEVWILGVTVGGQTFRPSDWAERLAGVMSSFRPGGVAPGDHLSYSPWCVPTTNEVGQKCVIVHVDLREAEVMAWDFVLNFARDNQLQVVKGALAL